MQMKLIMIATVLALTLGLSAAAAPATSAEKAAHADSSVAVSGKEIKTNKYEGKPMTPNTTTPSQTITLDGPDWTIATDPHDKGRDEKWFEAPRPEAKPATVPCTIQEIFPDYAGLAWYWKAFEAPKNPHPGGRYLLRFWMVDYKADVWVNGKLVGSHEIADEPFVLDATEAVCAGINVLAVRVLHPTATGIDGIVQQETPNGPKGGLPGSDWNFGGGFGR